MAVVLEHDSLWRGDGHHCSALHAVHGKGAGGIGDGFLTHDVIFLLIDEISPHSLVVQTLMSAKNADQS
jgi:hypothetical protein